MRRRTHPATLIVAGVLFEVGCGAAATSPTPVPSPPAPILAAAGDIATCTGDGAEATAQLLDGLFPAGTPADRGVVAALGDNAYPRGSLGDYMACYDPTWGRHRARTRPAPGNHEYLTPGAEGYFAYFGSAAGDPERGYYSYDVGTWHVVVLNSNCQAVGGCEAGSPQESWLRADLAAHPSSCALAYWHHPRFSSGTVHGDQLFVRDLWLTLQDYGVEIALAGHEHDYERFAPQTATGQRDDARGLREFVVGTGGKSHYSFGSILPNSEVRNSNTYGVLKLTLRAGSYEWQFVPEAGKSFTDSGSGTCH